MAGGQRSSEFCHNKHAGSLLQGLQELRSDNLLIDVTLCVSGKEIPCHRNVLAACSGYFRAMFCNGLRESNENKITIREVSAGAMQLLVDYAYTSKITITEDNVVKLLAGANFLQIEPVYRACMSFTCNNLSAKNCLKLLHLGGVLSCPDLEKEAKLYAMKEFASVSKTPEFLYLTKDQLIALISSDDLNASEDTVYTAVMTWINHDTRKRKKEMRELMEHVRFPFMDRMYFLENVESNEVMRKSCPGIVTETLKYQLFPGEVQSPRTRPRHVSGLREAVVIIGGVEKTEKTGEGSYITSSSAIAMTCSAEPSTSSWVPLTQVHQDFLMASATAVLDRRDIILSCVKDVFLIQPELKSCSRLAGLRLARDCHRLAVLQGKVYAIGGRNPASPALTSVEVYDRSKNKWTPGVPLPQPRNEHATAVLDGSIYVMGGFDADHKLTSTVYRFSPGDSQWQSLKDMPEAAGHTASVLNGSIYVAGASSTVHCFRPNEDGGHWSVAARGVRLCCGMTAYMGKLYIYGGQDNNSNGSSAVFCLDPETGSFNSAGTMMKGLFYHGCVTILKCC
ncbi:kelch-like protein 24 [Branchiostoma floridae]|uniref:Kelch-like protein 24 n=1 Tax=Branchiostoma floridae TaxID=7739 RepID=A0A9J7MBK7_BRAFL|nr:kelch-like protein 24 [Branchiostoma floridae]